jgi:OmpR family response regulator RpaB
VTTVLLIDDDERLASPLGDFLRRHNIDLINATDPENGLRMLRQGGIDLVILDVMLPGQDGFSVCHQIRRSSNIPVVMLSARGDVSDRLTGLEKGADDYIAKPFEPRELVMRIQNILRRAESPAFAGSRLRFRDLSIDKTLQQVRVADNPVNLSDREYQLLLMLASSPGRDFSRDDIFSFLRGTELELVSRAVDIQISRLRQKLRPTDYIKTIRGAGYRFVAPVDSGEEPADGGR